MNVRRGPQLGVALLIALAGCERAPEGTETAATSASAPSEPTSSEVPTGAFFLDLRTGEQTPLPSTGAKDFGAAVDDGHYYAVSPDGSTMYWENTCCLATDVAAVARIDGSQGRRLDPPGPINYYAGGCQHNSEAATQPPN